MDLKARKEFTWDIFQEEIKKKKCVSMLKKKKTQPLPFMSSSSKSKFETDQMVKQHFSVSQHK